MEKKMYSFIIPTTNIYYHIKELQYRFFYLTISIIFTFLISYLYSIELLYLYVHPFSSFSRKFIFTDLTEALSALLMVCLSTTLTILIPFLLYQFWSFLLPSLYQNERKKVTFFLSFFVLSFIFSFLATYNFILPEIYSFLLHYQINSLVLTVQVEARIFAYVLFSCQIYIIVFSLFQIPLVYQLFYQIGIVSPFWLSLYRKYFFLFFLVLASFLSPPDILTQLFIGLLFSGIYEIGIWFGFLHWVRKDYNSFTFFSSISQSLA